MRIRLGVLVLLALSGCAADPDGDEPVDAGEPTDVGAPGDTALSDIGADAAPDAAGALLFDVLEEREVLIGSDSRCPEGCGDRTQCCSTIYGRLINSPADMEAWARDAEDPSLVDLVANVDFEQTSVIASYSCLCAGIGPRLTTTGVALADGELKVQVDIVHRECPTKDAQGRPYSVIAIERVEAASVAVAVADLACR